MSLRSTIKQLSLAQCADSEIAEALRCRLGYVRQCLNRPATEGRFRQTQTIGRLPRASCAAGGSNWTAGYRYSLQPTIGNGD